MWLIRFALNRPWTVMVALVGVTLGCGLALYRMPVDVFPSLNLPVIYVCQPYGGMDPARWKATWRTITSTTFSISRASTTWSRRTSRACR